MLACSRLACVIGLGLLVSIGTGCQKKRTPPPEAQAPKPASELDQIVAWEDRRSLGGGQLEQWATQHGDPAIRARALLALGRIAAPSTAKTVAQALTDQDPTVRTQAAFSAGLFSSWTALPESVRTNLQNALLAAEAAETEQAVRLVQLEALGKVSTPPAVERLIARLYQSPAEVEARAALSLGVAAKWGAKLPEKVVTAVAPLMKGAPAARYGGAYALAMSTLPTARPALLLCTQEVDSEVRLLCARGLGVVGTDNDAVTLRKLLNDPDYRVVVEATRALAKLAERCKPGGCPAMGALADLSFRAERLVRGDVAGGGQPLLALAQQGLPASGRPVLMALRGLLAPAMQKDVANIDCRLAAAMDRQLGTLQEVLTCGAGQIDEVQRLVLGLRETSETPPTDPDARVDEVARYLRHADPRVQSAALGALGETQSMKAAGYITPFLNHADPYLATNAALAAARIGDRSTIPAIRQQATLVEKQPEFAGPISQALVMLEAKEAEPELRRWLTQPHPYVRHQAARALAKLTGQPVQVDEVEWSQAPFNRPYLPKNARVLIRTEKGDLEVALYTEDAPLTASNFYRLADRGFYRNNSFHRIVPDFVAQGGDPRGDGEGGPGYTIPDEFNRKPYVRGVVGMALSGPDTGGSQFFITHSPQPHLDGRYTAFGEVVSGRDVVDRLLEGDRITEIRAVY